MSCSVDDVVTLKRGDSVNWVATYLDDEENPVDLTGRTYIGQVRTKRDTLVADLTITVLNQVTNKGQMSIQFLASTQAWPLELLYSDIQETFGGIKTSSITFGIQMIADQSRP